MKRNIKRRGYYVKYEGIVPLLFILLSAYSVLRKIVDDV